MSSGCFPRIAALQPTPTSDEPSVTMMVSFLDNEKFASRALSSMLKTDYPKLNLILVYNPSTDRTLDLIKDVLKRSSTSHFRLIVNDYVKTHDRNLNDALSSTNDEYFIGANSDLFMEDPHWLKNLIAIATHLPHLGAISPCLLNWNDSSIQSCGGLRVPLSFEARNFVPKQEHSVFEIYAINGSLFLGPTQILKSVGGFWRSSDSNNPCGGEVELSLRLRKSGYKIYSTNHAKAHHLGGGTLGRDLRRSALMNYQAFLRINRNHLRNGLRLSLYNAVSFSIMQWRLVQSNLQRTSQRLPLEESSWQNFDGSPERLVGLEE